MLFPSSIKVVHFEVTYNCNHKCAFCPQCTPGRENKYLGREVVGYLAPCFPSMEHLILSGGEAFLWPHLKDLVNTALGKNPKLISSVVTNGTFFNEYWRDMVRQGFFRKINISFNAGTKETYKKIHGQDHFDKVIKNVEFLSKYRKSKLKILDISCVLSKNLIGELTHLTRLFAGKVDTITFQELNYYSTIKDYYHVNKITDDVWPQIEEELEECRKIAIAKGTNIRVLSKYTNPTEKGLKEFPEEKECRLPWSQLTILNSGEVRIGCCQSRHVIGNITNNSIDQILMNPIIEKLQNEMSKGNIEFCPEPRLLNKCPFITYRFAELQSKNINEIVQALLTTRGSSYKLQLEHTQLQQEYTKLYREYSQLQKSKAVIFARKLKKYPVLNKLLQ